MNMFCTCSVLFHMALQLNTSYYADVSCLLQRYYEHKVRNLSICHVEDFSHSKDIKHHQYLKNVTQCKYSGEVQI